MKTKTLLSPAPRRNGTAAFYPTNYTQVKKYLFKSYARKNTRRLHFDWTLFAVIALVIILLMFAISL